MLGMFSNKSDHPLANLKSAQLLLDELPKTDPVVVLHEIGQWIEALFDPANEFRLDHQFAVLRVLDDAAHPHLRKVIQSYFSAVPPNAFHENRLWGAMSAYFTYCELGYWDLIAGLKNGEKGGAAIKASLALIIARGIYAVSGNMECAAVKYAQFDPQLWIHLAEFYACAEAENCLDEPISPYAGSGAATSIIGQFASVLMWYAASAGSFRPLDLHMARLLIVYLSKSFTVSGEYQSDSLYTFDLAHPSAPVRVKEEGAMYPGTARFVGMGAAFGQLDSLIKTLSKDMVPEELNMGAAYSAEAVSGVVRRLVGSFEATMPVRRPVRHKIKMNISVLNGFFNIVEQTNVDLNLNDPVSENLEVENISANGLSYILPKGHASSLKIGTLVGLQPDQALHWGAGIVRRLRRDADNNLHVGVRILANKVLSVMMHGGSDNMTYPALYLERPDDQNGESWILTKPDTFYIKQSHTVEIGEQSYLLLPLSLEEKGIDFDIVRYRKMAQDNNSAEETF